MKHTQLEMIYLMNVALHLSTMKDIETFEQINHKTSNAIESLKVNPWFKTERDIVDFHTRYNQPTISLRIKDRDNGVYREQTLEALITCERIRNLVISVFPSGKVAIILNTKDSIYYPLESIISKCESLSLVNVGVPFNGHDEEIKRINNHETENHLCTIQEVFSVINRKMKVTFDSTDLFEQFDHFMMEQPNWRGIYPRKVLLDQIIGYNNQGAFGPMIGGPIPNPTCHFPQTITHWDEKNIYIVARMDYNVKLSQEDLEWIETSVCPVYVDTFDKDYSSKNNIIYFLSKSSVSREENKFLKVPFECLEDEETRNILFNDMKKLCCGIENISNCEWKSPDLEKENDGFRFIDGGMYGNGLKQQRIKEKIKLPDFVKWISMSRSDNSPIPFPFPFELDGIEELHVINYEGRGDKPKAYKMEIPINNSLQHVKLMNVEIVSPIQPSKKKMTLGKKHFTSQSSQLNETNQMNVFRNVKTIVLDQVDLKYQSFPCVQKMYLNGFKEIIHNEQIDSYLIDVNVSSNQLKTIQLSSYNSSKFNLYITDSIPIYLNRLSMCVISITVKENVHPQLIMDECKDVQIISTDSDNKFFDQLNGLLIKQCSHIVINQPLSHLKILKVELSDHCQLNVPSMSLEKIKLTTCKLCHFKINISQEIMGMKEMISSTLEYSWTTETLTFSVMKCNDFKLLPQQNGSKIFLEDSSDIQVNNQVNYHTFGIKRSSIITENISVETVLLHAVESLPMINWKQVKEMHLIEFKNVQIDSIFDSCEKLTVCNCDDCEILLTEEEQQKMKHFISFGNTNCILPTHIPNEEMKEMIYDLSNKGEDEYLELKNENVIIRNATDIRLHLLVFQKTNILFEDCHNMTLDLPTDTLKTITFINCSFVKLTENISNSSEYIPLYFSFRRITLEQLIIKDSHHIYVRNENSAFAPSELFLVENSVVRNNLLYFQAVRHPVRVKRIELRKVHIDKAFFTYSSNTLILDQCLFFDGQHDFHMNTKQMIIKSIHQSTHLKINKVNPHRQIRRVRPMNSRLRRIVFENCSQLMIETEREIQLTLKNCSEMKVNEMNQRGERLTLLNCDTIEDFIIPLGNHQFMRQRIINFDRIFDEDDEDDESSENENEEE